MYRVKDAVYPGIVQSESGAEVRGLLYDGLDEDTLFELDAYESSFYSRMPVRVLVDDGTEVDCQAYVVPDSRRDLLTDERWDKDWFRTHELQRYLNG